MVVVFDNCIWGKNSEWEVVKIFSLPRFGGWGFCLVPVRALLLCLSTHSTHYTLSWKLKIWKLKLYFYIALCRVSPVLTVLKNKIREIEHALLIVYAFCSFLLKYNQTLHESTRVLKLFNILLFSIWLFSFWIIWYFLVI